jgi:hypothetical protein
MPLVLCGDCNCTPVRLQKAMKIESASEIAGPGGECKHDVCPCDVGMRVVRSVLSRASDTFLCFLVDACTDMQGSDVHLNDMVFELS